MPMKNEAITTIIEYSSNAVERPLTPRESEACALLASGYAGKAIAERMGVSLSRVRKLLDGAATKLDAVSTTHLAVRFALSNVAKIKHK